mmetsp:Transcript_15653/g.36575  ORF Transcript_15653/g.36575 Transcript_15653/m.36575 type:complete len:252 (-) Transcript_15653:275-1030(-)
MCLQNVVADSADSLQSSQAAQVPVIEAPEVPLPVIAAAAQPGEEGTCAFHITRGARRRQQQRQRKKQGKLERRLAAAQSPVPAKTEELPQPLPIIIADEIEEVSFSLGDEIEEVPFLLDMVHHQTGDFPVIDNVADLLALEVGATATTRIVPICAVQEVPKLEDRPELEVLDTFVALPSCRWEKSKEAKLPGEPAELDLSVATKGGVSLCVPVLEAWPLWLGKQQIPTCNTFVHFPLATALQPPHRRSCSV